MTPSPDFRHTGTPPADAGPPPSHPQAVRPLANDFVTLFESPDPQSVFGYSPGLAAFESERLAATAGPRLIATIDTGGPGVADLDGPKHVRAGHGSHAWQGRVYTSDDHGRTWTQRTRFPFLHARPFVAGEAIYVLGQAGDLTVIRSDDGGETWTAPATLTDGENWHQAPSNVWYANGCVYLAMEVRIHKGIRTWNIGENAPVLMRGRLGDDLTKRENWTFASRLPFHEVIDNSADCPELDWHGIPFYRCPYPSGGNADGVDGRNCAPIGWLETNVVQFFDPDHRWHDPDGKTFHLWARAHTGGTGYAAIAKVVEDAPGRGAMTTAIETVPSGKKILYVPCPGGQMKFHVLYDDATRLFWLLSSQATRSMTRADRLPDGHFNLPNNERRRLQLHFSTNMVDWCFAGLVAVGPCERGSRHYASMAIDGDDLHILSRSGDERARNAHDGNLITFHTLKNFRGLVY